MPLQFPTLSAAENWYRLAPPAPAVTYVVPWVAGVIVEPDGAATVTAPAFNGSVRS